MILQKFQEFQKIEKLRYFSRHFPKIPRNCGHRFISPCLHHLPHLPQSKFCICIHMRVGEWTDRYSIPHWRIFFTNELHPNAPTDCAIRPWVYFALRTNFVHLLQFHLLFSVQISFWQLPLWVATFTTIKILHK